MVRFKDTLTHTNPDFFETAHVFTRIDPPYAHESSECGHRNRTVLKLLTGGNVRIRLRESVSLRGKLTFCVHLTTGNCSRI